MFTCFEVLPESERFLERLYERIKPPEPKREFVQLGGATPFLRLIVKENFIDFKKISSCLEKDERRILLPKNITAPKNANLDTHIPTSLGLNLMFNEVKKLLSTNSTPTKVSLSIFDENASLYKRIEEIVPYVRQLTIYTSKIREYFYLSQQIMEEWGLSIKINEYEIILQAPKIALTDKYFPDMKTSQLVFSANREEIYFNTVVGKGYHLEKEIKELKSSLHDDFSFASFLYEYNNAKFLSTGNFESLQLAGTKTDAKALLKMLNY